MHLSRELPIMKLKFLQTMYKVYASLMLCRTFAAEDYSRESRAASVAMCNVGEVKKQRD